ncbi:nonstructural protein [Microviridae sp.]|nr:nonstructural protein [Microviridae sp.]
MEQHPFPPSGAKNYSRSKTLNETKETRPMKHYTFSIYDSKADAYLPPFFLHQEAMGIRAFSDAVNNPESQIHLHPADYTLFLIASFDDEKGEMIPMPSNKNLGNGIQYVRKDDDKDQLQLEIAQ